MARRGPAGFLDELRRRRVIRALLVYGTVAFAILQVIEPVMHGLHLPEWVLSAVVIVLALGFPLTTGLAWVYDLRATGVERTPAGTGAGAAALPRGARLAALLAALGIGVALPGLAWHFLLGAGSSRATAPRGEDPLAGARFLHLTEFGGIAQSAAISRDGRLVAFQSDHDGSMDVWVTHVGTGRFTNLTHGAAPEIVNPSIRALGFSPDGALVTFWGRRPDASGGSEIRTWAVPLLGGAPRPYLDGVAEHDWSTDATLLAYHTPGPGDPTYVRGGDPGSEPRWLHSAPAGLHAHFPTWAPDRAHVYFVQGALPDHMDLWRVTAAGGAAERVTHHDARVSHPVFVDARTLLYLATDPDGSGPRIHALDVQEPEPRRVSAGADRFTSLAGSADGRRLVASVASPGGALWRLPFDGSRADFRRAHRVPLTTGSASFPRYGPGCLVYVSSRGTSDGLWMLRDGTASELWSAPDTRIVGAPAVRQDGSRIALVARRQGRTLLYEMGADGTDARVVAAALDLRGSPAWSPDGRSLDVARVSDGTPHLVEVPLDGRPPREFVGGGGTDPAWSADGDLLLFSGPDVGTTFPIRAVRADGTPAPLPPITMTRGARHLVVLPGRPALLVLRGEIGHKDVWEIDLRSGAERRVTELPPDFEIRDLDVSPDGRELVLEQVQQRSEVVLIERPGS